LALASIACFVAALALMPSGARSQLGAGRRDPAAAATPPAQAAIAPIATRNDAFAPRATVDDDEPRAVVPSPPPLVPTPNVRPALVKPAQRAPVRVTALATGVHPTAIIGEGAASRIVTIGDRLDGSTIAAIGDDAVVLADGRRLSLEPETGSR
jgi:hypothetical protein